MGAKRPKSLALYTWLNIQKGHYIEIIFLNWKKFYLNCMIKNSNLKHVLDVMSPVSFISVRI